jgi:hypothetical protein
MVLACPNTRRRTLCCAQFVRGAPGGDVVVGFSVFEGWRPAWLA